MLCLFSSPPPDLTFQKTYWQESLRYHVWKGQRDQGFCELITGDTWANKTAERLRAGVCGCSPG